MEESKSTISIDQSVEALRRQIDDMQVNVGRGLKEQHEQSKAQIQHQCEEQISLLSKGIGDGMDRLETILIFKHLPNFLEDKEPVLETDTARNTDKGAVDSSGLSVVDENSELNQNEGRNHYQAVVSVLDVSFPEFDVTDVANWVFKCDNYFNFYRIVECHKTPMAVLHFNHTAITWYRDEKGNNEHLPWDVLKKMLIARFKDWRDVNSVEEFEHLDQTGSVEEYIEKFQVARSKILIEFPGTSEDYFVGSFVAGLKGEINNVVDMFENRTLKDAFHRAMQYERHLKLYSE